MNQSVSLRYLLVLVALACLCLITYSACRVYSLVGTALFLIFAIAFCRKPLTLAFMGLIAMSTIVIITMADVVCHGPVTTHHNQRLANTIQSNQLIGKSKEFAITVLGSPTSRYSLRSGETLNYAPFRLLNGGQVQLHCKNGMVGSIELYDD